MAGPVVKVPIRLSVDTAALAEGGIAVEETVQDPVRRALTKSQTKLAADGMPHSEAVVNAPEMVWTGAVMDPAERKRLEDEVKGAIDKAVRDSSVTVRTTAHTVPSEVELLVQPAASKLPGDPELAPSEAPVPKAAEQVEPTEEQWREMSLVSAVFGEDVLQALVAEAVARWGPVTSAHFGLIWRMGDIWWVLMRSDKGGRPRAFNFSDVHTWQLVGTAKEARWERVDVTLPPGRVRARILPARTAKERLAALRELFGEGIRGSIEEIARAGRIEEGTLEQEITAQVDAELERRSKTLSADIAGLVVLDVGGVDVVMPAPAKWMREFAWKGEAEFLPVTAPAPVPEEPVNGQGEAGGTCSQFLAEPSLDELGSNGEELRRQMDELSEALGIAPCPWAGGFALGAAAALRRRAHDAAEAALLEEVVHPGTTQARPKRDGNVVLVEFEPLDSPTVFELQRLAGFIPHLREFSEEIARAYRAHHTDQWTGPVFSHWLLKFSYEFYPRLHWTVASVFMSMCRVLLMQLLTESRHQIEGRKAPAYTELFERLIRPRLEEVENLQFLREQLEEFDEEIPGADTEAKSGAQPSVPVPADWYAARKGVQDVLRVSRAREVAERVGRGRIEMRGDEAAIRDTNGQLWTAADLDKAAIASRGVAEAIDPFVKQLTDLPDVVERLRDSNDQAKTLGELIKEMATLNEEQRRKVLHEPAYGFRAGRIVSGTGQPMRGIHKLAEDKLAAAAGNDEAYRAGVRLLFAAGHGRQEILHLVEFTGIILLAVVCPPVGFVAGVAAAGYHYHEAVERKELYGAQIDPERVMGWAEIESEMFAAKLGLALSFLPVVPELAAFGRASAAARTASSEVLAAGSREAVTETAKAELRVAAQRVGARTFRRSLEKHAVETLKAGLNRSLATAFVQGLAIGHALNLALTPLIGAWMSEVEREALRTGPVGGLEGAGRTIQSMLPDQGKGS